MITGWLGIGWLHEPAVFQPGLTSALAARMSGSTDGTPKAIASIGSSFDHCAVGGPDLFRARKLAGSRRKIEPWRLFSSPLAPQEAVSPVIGTQLAQTSLSPASSPDSLATLFLPARRIFWTRRIPPRVANKSPDSTTARTVPGASEGSDSDSTRLP